MFSRSKFAALAVAALLPFASAQTSTSCNPTEKSDCPSDAGLNATSFSTDFTTTTATSFTGWNTTAGTVTGSENGAKFTIAKRYDAPTIETDFYFLFGRVDVKMRAANGTGIVSSVILESDDLDEVDWEALGGDTTQIETNYFGKGNTTTYDRATYVTVTTPQSVYHTYSLIWTSSSIEWLIDEEVVRTLTYANASNGAAFPQTPCRLKMGIWAGGDSSNSEGTIEWAGGSTDYSDVPFTMYIESVNITNYTPAAVYTYGDETGDYTSIKASNSTSGITSLNGKITSSDGKTSSFGSSNSSSTTSSTSSTTGSKGVSSSSGSALAASSSATTTSSSTSSGASFKPAIGFGSFMGLIGFFFASVILV